MLAALNLDTIAGLVFLDIAVIIVVARLMGMLFRKIGQPAVVGEIIAGIILGPTVLGAFPVTSTSTCSPPTCSRS